MVEDLKRTGFYFGLAAVAYFVSARLGYTFAIPHGTVTLWPPSGVMLGLLLLSNRRDWPALLAGGFSGSLASHLFSGYAVGLSVAAGLANSTESVMAAGFLTWLQGTPWTLSSLRAVVGLAIGAASCSNAVTSVLAAAVLHLGIGLPFGEAWFVWWVGHGLGTLIVTPVVLTWATSARNWRHLKPFRLLEAAVLLGLLIAAAQIALGPNRGWAVEPGPYITFPLLFWAALRFGPLGAATASLILAAEAIGHTALGVGPFAIAGTSGGIAATRVYAYISMASISSLIPAAVLQEHRAAREQLWQSNERYRTVVETASDAILTIDRDSRIEFANSAVERIFGYKAQEVIGRDLTMLMPAHFRELHKSAINRYLATGKKHFSWQGALLTGLHKNGTEIPLEVSFGELAEGGHHLFTGIVRDISEKRAAEEAHGVLEEQYRESQKMDAIGQLAGGIAHDFNNLLTVITGYCELLRDDLGSASHHQTDLAEIERAAERAASLTRQLLAFSRRQILEPRVLSLSDSLRAMEPMLKRLIGEHIDVVVRTPPEIGHIKADAGQIEQVILNLGINARDAMPDGGTLLLELMDVELDVSYTRQHVDASPGPHVMLAVSDTGGGMDAATAARVFEPFFTTKPKGQGTGLGLSTVHGIVKQSGGIIGVYSEPGAGTTFKVYLPRVDAPIDVTPAATTVETRHGSETILLLEDEDAVRGLAERVLEQHGYRVLAAATPGEALGLAAGCKGGLHLLLSDVVLPGMSGTSLAHKLLADHPGLSVLYMSGYTDGAIVQNGVLERDTPFIQKPFTPEALLRKVRAVLDRRDQSREG
jgi:PAS domain S-box-containing protein